MALAHPDQYVQDTFTIWWFIEFNVGMIAASLPALKPLLIRFIETVKGTSTPSKGSGPRFPGELGYQRQGERFGKEVMLEEYIIEQHKSVKVSSEGYPRLGQVKVGEMRRDGNAH